ncbi:MAG: hypothetical protein MJ223_03330 [Mycoplasmoidaceae bacterium]|nr:hypothetical protein [Mycoplasmoidaceae bacterium]
MIITAVFGAVIAAAAIAWVVTYFVLKNKQYKEDPNKQKIDKALEKLEEQRKKHESDSKLV